MDQVPLVREVSSVFSVSNNPSLNLQTAQMMKSVAKWTYILVALIVVFGGSYYLFNKMQRPVAGVLYFIGATIAVYFYYVKWFVIPAMRPEWPPYQTVCPDYLTPIAPGYTRDANGNQVPTPGPMRCVDFVGVSRNGRLKRADPATISKHLNEEQYAFTVDPKMSRDELRQRINSYGLSWLTMFGEK
jgi:hypothetical protein